MEVSYRKSLNKSYMCVENPEHVFDTYELRMLNNCKVPGLLRLQVADLDNRQRYLYDISGKQQISDYLSRQKPGSELLRRILFSIQRICAVLPEYLLREDGICLEMNFIYVNLEDGSLQFTYLPFYTKNFPHSFQCCMEQILRMIDHQDQKAVELGYQTYQLCLQDNADIRKILMTVLCKEQVAQKEQNKNEVDLTRQERTSRKSPSSTRDSYQLAGESLGNKRKEKKIVVKERWRPKALPGIINRYFTKMAEAVNNFKKYLKKIFSSSKLCVSLNKVGIEILIVSLPFPCGGSSYLPPYENHLVFSIPYTKIPFPISTSICSPVSSQYRVSSLSTYTFLSKHSKHPLSCNAFKCPRYTLTPYCPNFLKRSLLLLPAASSSISFSPSPNGIYIGTVSLSIIWNSPATVSNGKHFPPIPFSRVLNISFWSRFSLPNSSL